MLAFWRFVLDSPPISSVVVWRPWITHPIARCRPVSDRPRPRCTAWSTA